MVTGRCAEWSQVAVCQVGQKMILMEVLGLGEKILPFGLHKRSSKLQRLADHLHIVFRGISQCLTKTVANLEYSDKRIEIGFYLLFLIELNCRISWSDHE